MYMFVIFNYFGLKIIKLKCVWADKARKEMCFKIEICLLIRKKYPFFLAL
jgi:hypothetical protein